MNMMKTMKRIPTTHLRALVLMPLAVTLSACGPSTPENGDDAAGQSRQGDKAGSAFLMTEVPDNPPGLLAALESAGPEDAFVFTGRVGGLAQPLSPDYAGFVVADEVVYFCDEGEDPDHCAMPWDACCEDPDKVAASRAFVQFVDGDGNLLASNLREVIGLAENDTVVVQGRLAPESTPGNRIILAEGLAIVD
jgi:hypothetical protein